MSLFHIIVLSICVALCSGLFFRSNSIASADGREIEESCVALADQGSCDFYNCFERRLPCGREWYIMRTGLYYCNKMQRRKPNFSQAGQNFIDATQRCLTQALKDAYRSNEVDCHSLEHRAINSVTPCFTQHGFCGIIRRDSAELFRIFEFQDLFTRGAGKLWREILVLAASCTRETINEISNNARDIVNDAVDNVVESLPDSL